MKRVRGKLMVAGAAVLIGGAGLGPSLVAADANCDVCNDIALPPGPSNCRTMGATEIHKKTGSGGSGGWYMLHTDSDWYCRGCDIHVVCPFGGEGDPPPIEEDPEDEFDGQLSAAVRTGDPAMLRVVTKGMETYLRISPATGMLAVTDCQGQPVAQYKLTAAQMHALAEGVAAASP